VSVRLKAVADADPTELPREPGSLEASTDPPRRTVRFSGKWIDTPVWDRDQLGRGSRIVGPAVVELRESTCVVRPGWEGTIDATGSIVLERA
jgi:N-methylhydantoinase A